MMQPYFFPYLGYFALIAATDEWVVFDTAQYIRRGWVNRNRVLSSGKDGWKYIRIPVEKSSQLTRICEMKTASSSVLFTNVVNSLDDYRCWETPFYDETRQLLEACLTASSDDLTDCLVRCLTQTCEHLQIPFAPRLYSTLDITQPADPQPGDWALQTALQLGATEYLNPPGGRDLFDPTAFHNAGIHLTFLEHKLPRYQQRAEFIAGLSIIDVLMWNGRIRTRELLTDYQLDQVA
jgi:hypothetical protein